MTSLATSLPVAQWLECPTGVREVMGSIPVGDSVFSLSHAREKLNIPSFLRKSYSFHVIRKDMYAENLICEGKSKILNLIFQVLL